MNQGPRHKVDADETALPDTFGARPTGTTAAVSAASCDPSRSPAVNSSAACPFEGDLRRLPPQPECTWRVLDPWPVEPRRRRRSGRSRRARPPPRARRSRTRRAIRMPSQRSGTVKPAAARRSRSPPAAPGSPWRPRASCAPGRIAMPGSRRERARQLPFIGRPTTLVVGAPGLPPGLEQGQVGVAGDPRPPQVVVGRPGSLLQQIQEPPPVGRPIRRFGSAPRRPRRPSPRRWPGAGTPPPDPRHRPTPRAGRRHRPDRRPPGKPERRRIGVILGLVVFAADRAPGVERDPCRLELRGERVGGGLDPELLGGLQPVVRGERLVCPSVGQQPAVEPGVRDSWMTTKSPARRRPRRALRRIEQPGVAAGRPARRLVEQETAVARPVEPDLLGSTGSPRATRPPTRSPTPGRPPTTGSSGGRARRRARARHVRRTTRAIADEVGEERQRLVELPGLEDDVPVRFGRRAPGSRPPRRRPGSRPGR